MEASLAGLRGDLEAAIALALRQQLMSNRGTFAPFRVAPTAKSLVGALIDGDVAAATSLGSGLGVEGLSLASLTFAQTSTLALIAERAAPSSAGALISQASQVFSGLLIGLVDASLAESQRQRDEIERAFRSVLDEQREQGDRLRDVIRELSSPIIPIHAGILVLPLIGAIDSQRANEITEHLLEAIAKHQAALVILDITGVAVLDTSTANHLLMTTRAAALLGSRIVLTGIGPEVAQSVVHLGIDLHDLVTFGNLQAGLDYALAKLGLAIQPRASRSRA